MCGRIVCHASLDEFATALQARVDPVVPTIYQPSYNRPPSQPLPIVFGDGGDRHLRLARWGLLPHWAKDESVSFKTFNARAETVHEKPSFRGAFKYRRCLIPINGYYEWKRSGKSKIPYYFYPVDGDILVLAGLFELWQDSLLTCTVITTVPNAMAAEVHNRMPVILEHQSWTQWLTASPQEARTLLSPIANDQLAKHPVDSAVNAVKTNGPHLINALL